MFVSATSTSLFVPPRGRSLLCSHHSARSMRSRWRPALADDGANVGPRTLNSDAGKILSYIDNSGSIQGGDQHDAPFDERDKINVSDLARGSIQSYSNQYKLQHAKADDMTAETSPSCTSSSSTSSSLVPAGEVSGRGGNKAGSLASALDLAHQALYKAECSLDGIDTLPSARPENDQEGPINWPWLLSIAKSAVILVAVSTALLASHGFGLIIQWSSAVVGAVAVAIWGYNKGSLSTSGAMAAAVVGLATLGCSLRFGATLLAFYFTSSKLTQYKEHIKVVLDDNSRKGGQRDWLQVCCNALLPSVFSVIYGFLVGCVDVPLGPLPSLESWRCQAATALMGAFLGYYACCCGDTWASELGPLSPDTPRLITTLRPVRKGTNGGVTVLGLLASILGGTFLGVIFYVSAASSPTLFVFEDLHSLAMDQWRLIPLGTLAGLAGSLLDSLLGATLQFSGYNEHTGRVTSSPGPGVQHISGLSFLSNNAVNAISASCTAIITAFCALKMFGF